jgi:hypothetical protein
MKSGSLNRLSRPIKELLYLLPLQTMGIQFPSKTGFKKFFLNRQLTETKKRTMQPQNPSITKISNL